MKSSIKLNLGCGYDHKKGFINIDIDPQVKPNLILDLNSLTLPFLNSCVDEILLQDVLEHITKQQALILLDEIFRVLKPNGKINIRIPNIFSIMESFESDPEVMFEFLYGNTEHNGYWGVHKYGYTETTLEKLLLKKGFKFIKLKEDSTNIWASATKRSDLEKINLLVVQQSPDWGGAEEWMLSLTSELKKQANIKITAATNLEKLKNSWEEFGISVTNIPTILDVIGNWKGLVKSILRLPRLLFFYLSLLINFKRNGGNLILMSGFSEKILVSHLASFLNIKVIWYEYAPLDSVFKRNFGIPKYLYILTNHIPEKVVTLSKSSVQSLSQVSKISKAKIEQIYPGVDLVSKTIKIESKNNFVVGCLARVAREKGQYELLESWLEVIRQFPNSKLLIAGNGPDLDNLRNLVDEYNLGDSVSLLGFVEDKNQFYSQLDLFVYPGKWELEGFGLVLAEAMSCGIPVIAFDQSPMNEVVGSSGELVSTEDKLSVKIIKLLDDIELKKIYSKKGKKRSEKLFNKTDQIKKIYKILQETVNLLK